MVVVQHKYPPNMEMIQPRQLYDQGNPFLCNDHHLIEVLTCVDSYWAATTARP